MNVCKDWLTCWGCQFFSWLDADCWRHMWVISFFLFQWVMMWVDIFQNPLSMAIKFKSQVAKNNQKKLIKGKKNRIENTTSVILLGDLHPDSTPIFFSLSSGRDKYAKVESTLHPPHTHDCTRWGTTFGSLQFRQWNEKRKNEHVRN